MVSAKPRLVATIAGRDPEGEGDLAEGSAGSRCRSSSRAAVEATRHPRTPAGQAQERRLDDEGEQDRAPREPDRAQGADLAGARGHDPVHRVHGREHRPDAHDHRDQPAQGLDGVGHGPGLVLVVLPLRDRAQQHVRLEADPAVEGRDLRRVRHAEHQRFRARPAPERGAAGSRNRPRPRSRRRRPPTRRRRRSGAALRRYRRVPPSSRPAHAVQDPAAHHHLVEAGSEEPARRSRGSPSARGAPAG